MLSRLREPFGKAGLIVAIVALVATTVGGAYAANKRNHKKGNAAAAQAKKFSKAFSKRYSKIFSKRFAIPGPPGTQGPAGSNGAKGDTGSPGTNGTNGESVTVESYEGPECAEASGEAGAKFSNGTGTAYACNGAAPGGTLGEGESLAGTWAASAAGPVFSGAFSSISFQAPLASDLDDAHTLMEGVAADETAFNEHCTGSAAAPAADSGYLCVYETFATGPATLSIQKAVGEPGASSFGAVLAGVLEEEGSFFAYGSWAVTG